MTAYDDVHREAMQDRADDPPERDYSEPRAGDELEEPCAVCGLPASEHRDGNPYACPWEDFEPNLCAECGTGLEEEERDDGMCRRCVRADLEGDRALERERDDRL